MTDISDLEIFVLTHNRAKQLGIMLDSLCNQTQMCKITILNNASTDNTLQVIKEKQFEYPHIQIDVITHPYDIGNIGNFKKSQELASKSYTAVFHDDDAIHPEYIERAMSLLRKYDDAVLCTGSSASMWCVNNYNWPLLNSSYYLYPAKYGAYFQMMIIRSVFQSAIYRTDVYKKLKYESEKYGKYHDIIFLMEAGKYGQTIHIDDVCVRIGYSPRQDSNLASTGPFPYEVCELLAYIDELIADQRYAKPVLWNFAYMLYDWAAYLSRFETWEVFSERMKEKGIFTQEQIMEFSLKPVMDKINGEILAWAELLKRSCYKAYNGPRSGIQF